MIMPETRIGILIILGLLGLAALGWVFYRRRQFQRAVQNQFREFREQAVVLMDRLDSLRQRHKTMTSTDPDFEVPMAGATRALHDSVSEDLERLWDRWLRVMEVWNRAHERLAKGSSFSTGPIEEARALLEGGGLEALVRETGTCQERIDRLNRAHERAREELQEVRRELASVQNAITDGTGVLLPSDRFHTELQDAERALADAELRIASDPIGAEQLIMRTRSNLGRLSDLPEWQPAWSAGDFTLDRVFEELSSAAERLKRATSRLWSTSLPGLFVRAWVALSAVFLFIVLLLPLLPFVLFFVVALLVLAFFGAIARAQLKWFWRLASGSLFGDRRARLDRPPTSRGPPTRSF
jgi:hypothetical protein